MTKDPRTAEGLIADATKIDPRLCEIVNGIEHGIERDALMFAVLTLRDFVAVLTSRAAVAQQEQERKRVTIDPTCDKCGGDGIVTVCQPPFPERDAACSCTLPEAAPPPADEGLRWQPISTAPKDGTELLLYRDRRIVSGSWNRGGAMHMPHWMGGNFDPTHWMLKPADPVMGDRS